MLRTETVSSKLLSALHVLMGMKSLQNFRLVGGTALSLQLGHRKSVDIDMFSSDTFASEEICTELIEKFKLTNSVKPEEDIMIRTITNDGIKLDIVNNKSPFIRAIVCEDGVRMAHVEEIAAMKIKITCDPFSGRSEKKDFVDIASLLDKYSIKQMMTFFKLKYPTMSPYEESVITRLCDFNKAEVTEMPHVLTGLTWENTKQKIEKGLKIYFDDILKSRESKLKNK